MVSWEAQMDGITSTCGGRLIAEIIYDIGLIPSWSLTRVLQQSKFSGLLQLARLFIALARRRQSSLEIGG